MTESSAEARDLGALTPNEREHITSYYLAAVSSSESKLLAIVYRLARALTEAERERDEWRKEAGRRSQCEADADDAQEKIDALEADLAAMRATLELYADGESWGYSPALTDAVNVAPYRLWRRPERGPELAVTALASSPGAGAWRQLRGTPVTPEDLARLTESERGILAHSETYGLQGVVDLCTRLALARRVVEAARARLALEGHETGCQFRGCTCGRYDEAKATRQDVQRALATHDAEVGR